MKKNIVFSAFLFFLLSSCAGSYKNVDSSNTEVIVHYENKEVYRKNSKYIGKPQLEEFLKQKKEVVVIFAADWCQNCNLVRRAVGQAKLKTEVYYLNIDEIWVQQMASLLGFNSVPKMYHIGANGNTIDTKEGAGQIVTYLVGRF